jgi:sulfate adenylyltransferase subunit 2
VPAVLRSNRSANCSCWKGGIASGGRFGPAMAKKLQRVPCRFCSLGCVSCSAAARSEAVTVAGIIAELQVTCVSERSTRVIDHDADATMDCTKRESYF